MSPVLGFILVTVVSFLNLLDKSLQVFGIKLFRMDKELMMKRLTPELQEETKSKRYCIALGPFHERNGKRQNDGLLETSGNISTIENDSSKSG